MEKRGAEYKTFIRPHSQNISDVLQKIKLVLRQSRDVITVVERLNPVIREVGRIISIPSQVKELSVRWTVS